MNSLTDSTNLNIVKHSLQRVNFLDGLRGVGAVMVLLSHTFETFLFKDFKEFPLPSCFMPLFNGQFAVFLFFVASGFSLSIAYVRSKDAIILHHMAIRRYFRLAIPVMTTSFVYYLFLKFDLMWNLKILDISAGKVALSSMYYNMDVNWRTFLQFIFYDVFFDHATNRSYNIVLWTMSIEFLASFFIFIVLSVFGVKKIRVALYPLLFLYLLYFESYLASFVAGIIIAEDHNRRQKKQQGDRTAFFYAKELSTIVLFVVIVLQAAGIRYYNYISGYTLLASFVVYLVSSSFSLRHVFENKVASFLGRISFPLYLTHELVICSFASWFYKQLYGHMDFMHITLLVGLTTVGLSVALAWFFYPLERFSIAFSRAISNFVMLRP